MAADLLSIGRFARLTRLSVRQLRRYDELQLLAPAVVDPDTGYRFYHRRQARTAATVALLRELDVPLATVRELLVAEPEAASALLQAERDRRAAELDRAARSVAMLSRLAAEPERDPEVTVVREAPGRLWALTREATPETVGAVTTALADALAAALPDPSPPFVALFPVDVPDSFDVVLGVPLAAGASPPPGTTAVDLPGGPCAAVVHDGPRDTLALSWWPLLAWVHERGLEPAGPVRETYLDPHTTRLTVPLKEER
ncbi:Multidrug-efflux transporter 1 regulator [Paraconexibacter sp. AEG42_29]|uniref:Multidrug-efflux transporter 1 regulator n=1 Tax=Paraconexibacter sp. AEG42_29 TaxID=2997339 RepID=A0AAU7B0K6_9ACTN